MGGRSGNHVGWMDRDDSEHIRCIHKENKYYAWREIIWRLDILILMFLLKLTNQGDQINMSTETRSCVAWAAHAL